MALARRCTWLVVLALAAALAFPNTVTEAAQTNQGRAPAAGNIKVFDVTKYGAKGDGKPVYDDDGESINGLHIMGAWGDACDNTEGQSKLLIPNGTFVVAQTVFSGHCKSHVTIELQGTVEPDPDDSQFPNHELLSFQEVSNVTLTGPGKVDATNRGRPRSKDPNREIDFFSLLPLIRIFNATNMVVDGINFWNSYAFNILVSFSRNITIQNANFDAESLVPESDTSGVYIAASSQVAVLNSSIRTGDYCINIAPGSSEVFVSGVTCLAGQGISIGEDGYYEVSPDVKNVTVKNCTFKETTFGANVFPRTQANRFEVSNITFEHLVMEKVRNPIVINPQRPLTPNKSVGAKVRDVIMRHIRGTTTSRNAVNITCDPKLPCEGIHVAGVKLKYVGKPLLRKALGVLVTCSNADVVFGC